MVPMNARRSMNRTTDRNAVPSERIILRPLPARLARTSAEASEATVSSGNQETRRTSWRGGLDRPEISSRAVACPPELQVPPKWVKQAPYARRFRTKAARSARCAGGICAVVARYSRQYTGRVPGGPLPRISRTLASCARESIAGAIVAEGARVGHRTRSVLQPPSSTR
jgi:hypothetical protein